MLAIWQSTALFVTAYVTVGNRFVLAKTVVAGAVMHVMVRLVSGIVVVLVLVVAALLLSVRFRFHITASVWHRRLLQLIRTSSMPAGRAVEYYHPLAPTTSSRRMPRKSVYSPVLVMCSARKLGRRDRLRERIACNNRRALRLACQRGRRDRLCHSYLSIYNV
jgi:hypothetical protein